MATSTKRKKLKKQYEKLKNMQRNNLPKGQSYTVSTMADLKKFHFKNRMSALNARLEAKRAKK